MLERITPLVLTYNEAPNIGRTLGRLTWARDIVVVDSYSDDETVSLVSKFPQARVVRREFDSLEGQWNYALEHTGISTEWVLALDADYVLTPAFVEELGRLRPAGDVNGYRAAFKYCVYGRPLRGSAYPPVTVLYRRAHARYRQDGHAHRVVVSGRVEPLRESVLHDDRKSVARWLHSQGIYQRQELDKLEAADRSRLGWPDRVRRRGVFAPFLALFYCLFIRRGILDGKAGLFYAYQRMLAETILSTYLLDRELERSAAGRGPEAESAAPPAGVESV